MSNLVLTVQFLGYLILTHTQMKEITAGLGQDFHGHQARRTARACRSLESRTDDQAAAGRIRPGRWM